MNGLKTTGLRLVSARVNGTGVVREGTTGRVVVLPNVWAVGEVVPQRLKPVAVERQDGRAEARPLQSLDPVKASGSGRAGCVRADETGNDISESDAGSLQRGAEVAFYRKYTEAMVKRYRTMSMEAGRVPSLVGRELFRGKVSSYRVESFEDAVIFCHDMEKCLLKLNRSEQKLVKRIALQEYSFGETAGMLGLSLSNCIRQYGRAVDRLTAILLEVKLLRPLGSL